MNAKFDFHWFNRNEWNLPTLDKGLLCEFFNGGLISQMIDPFLNEGALIKFYMKSN